MKRFLVFFLMLGFFSTQAFSAVQPVRVVFKKPIADGSLFTPREASLYAQTVFSNLTPDAIGKLSAATSVPFSYSLSADQKQLTFIFYVNTP